MSRRGLARRLRYGRVLQARQLVGVRGAGRRSTASTTSRRSPTDQARRIHAEVQAESQRPALDGSGGDAEHGAERASPSTLLRQVPRHGDEQHRPRAAGPHPGDGARRARRSCRPAGRCRACRSPASRRASSWCRQIGAGVWIEFEQGDPDYPIWTGGFWGSPPRCRRSAWRRRRSRPARTSSCRPTGRTRSCSAMLRRPRDRRDRPAERDRRDDRGQRHRDLHQKRQGRDDHHGRPDGRHQHRRAQRSSDAVAGLHCCTRREGALLARRAGQADPPSRGRWCWACRPATDRAPCRGGLRLCRAGRRQRPRASASGLRRRRCACASIGAAAPHHAAEPVPLCAPTGTPLLPVAHNPRAWRREVVRSTSTSPTSSMAAAARRRARPAHPRPDRAGAVHGAGRAGEPPDFGSGLLQLSSRRTSEELAPPRSSPCRRAAEVARPTNHGAVGRRVGERRSASCHGLVLLPHSDVTRVQTFAN